MIRTTTAVALAGTALGLLGCSTGAPGVQAHSGGWCYMRASDNGKPVYAWPAPAYQPVSASDCAQLASGIGGQIGYTLTVVATVPSSADPVCVGDFDGVTVTLSSKSSGLWSDMCDPLNFTPPVP